jgi:RHS repeat-associated protein
MYFLWLLGDHLGSTSQVANNDGSAYTNGKQLYKPWGEKRYPTGASGLPTTYRYTGQRQDSYINLYWYGSRWYDDSLGRFIQPDSIVPESQGTQAWDRYSYVNNNAVNHTDPTGHCFLVCAAVGAVVGAVVGGVGTIVSQVATT